MLATILLFFIAIVLMAAASVFIYLADKTGMDCDGFLILAIAFFLTGVICLGFAARYGIVSFIPSLYS